MKNILRYVGIAVLLIACKRSVIEPMDTSSLVGNWKLVAYLADPGDGSGKWQAVSSFRPFFIEFGKDSMLGYAPPSPYGSSRYLVTSDSTMIIIRNGDSIRMAYQLDGASLTLTPPCLEPCGERYISVK